MRNYIFIAFIVLLSSCDKVDVKFGNDQANKDPDIVYLDNFPVDISTYQVDSFLTSSHKIFAIGYHEDPEFGKMTANSYAQVNLPDSNPVNGKNVYLDSIALILRPKTSYYGDTLLPFKINIHKLLEKIVNEDDNNLNFYNPRTFAFDPNPLASTTVTVKPTRGANISIRLPDSFGQDLLTRFKDNDNSITTQENFVNYFKGLYLGTDDAFTNSIFYFTPDTSGEILRLYYKLVGSVNEEKYLDFKIDDYKQFNHLSFDHSGTNLASFTPFRKQLKKSDLTGHKVYLHNNMGYYVKIDFPTILNIKELHPFVKVVKAQLQIKPSPGTYNYPYVLSPALFIYQTDADNGLISVFQQTGDPVLDDLYGENTAYTYDITGYITELVNEGQFSENALMLTGAANLSDSTTERMIINDQTFAKSLQLKLYVLYL